MSADPGALSPTERLVLYVLANNLDPTDQRSAYLSQKEIAAATGLGERTVRRALGALVLAGRIRRERRYGQWRGRLADRIVVVAPLPRMPRMAVLGEHGPEVIVPIRFILSGREVKAAIERIGDK
jgi:hypothetical protein